MQGPRVVREMVAGADLSAKQFYFVKDSSGQVVACAATTDRPIGVLQNKPDASGQRAEVCIFGETFVSADADLALFAEIGTSADGQAAAKVYGTNTTHYVVGHVTEDPSGANSQVRAFINCINPPRGA